MKRFWLVWAGLAVMVAVVGCNSTRPASPVKVYSLKVSIPSTSELHSSLLTSSNNELLYRVDGPGMATLKGTLGPFVSLAATGSIDFSIDVPAGEKRVLSLQLNDASTHSPLAIGAAGFDLSGESLPISILTMNLGSVVRNCYNINTVSYFGMAFGVNTNYVQQSSTFCSTCDFGVGALATGYEIIDAEGNTGGAVLGSTVAYLGNGNFVDYDTVPPIWAFYSKSSAAKAAAGLPVTTAQTGDIYCIRLSTIPGAHAWVQIKTPGVVPAGNGATFDFRANDSKSYFAYYQTPPDIAGGCPAQ